MDITTLTLEQLESLAFKEIVKRDTAINNLNILQSEMQKRPLVVPILQETVESPQEGE